MIAMAKATKMVIMALVLSLLALPAFGVRREGLERMSFSSQPLNPLDHRPAGLIEVEARTGGRETENEDECSKELRSLEETFTEICERHDRANPVACSTQAKKTIEHLVLNRWQKHLASTVFDAGKTPVFWAGFWPGGEEGIDTRQALADFISSVNGFQLADTEWGQAAESEGANNLEACTWDRKKNWWNAAAINMAQAMAFHNVTKITIALHKTLHGHFSFYKTILYQAELPSMGHKMRSKSTWNPEFEVRSIAVKGAPPDESGCALASEVKSQLKLYASRPVTVWCRPCTTLQSCGDKQEVEDESVKGKCIEGDCQNGQGTQTWADGDIYQGQWKNGKKDGQGTYTWKDRNKYQGQWKNGKKDGQGTYTFANGDKYAGDFKNNIFDGQGTLAWAHGEKYQGGWKNGLEHGQGTYTFTNGEKYQGGWKNGLKEGHGTYTLANGNKYQGEWKNDKKDGQGTLTEANGNKYQGQWKNDLKEGQGTYTFPDGENYQGGWKNDLQHGQGTMIWADGIYEGGWKNGLQDGQGTYTSLYGKEYKVWHKEGHLTKKVRKWRWWR